MPLLSSIIGLMFLVIPPLLLHSALLQSKRFDRPYYKFREFVGRNKFIFRMLIYFVFIIIFTLSTPARSEDLTLYVLLLLTFLLTINTVFLAIGAMDKSQPSDLKWANVIWTSMIIVALQVIATQHYFQAESAC